MKKYIDKKFIAKDFIELVDDENKRQLSKWGNQIHTLFQWLTYTTEELGELAKAIAEFEHRDGTEREIIKEAVQTATLCLKIADMVGNEKIPTAIDLKMLPKSKEHQNGG